MRAELDLDLDPDDVLDRVAASFDADRDGAWTLTRRGPTELRVETGSGRGYYVFDPIPSGQALLLPETLALDVEVAPLPDSGARLVARIVRTRVAATLAMVALDLLSAFGFHTVLHAAQLVEYRRERRAGMRRLLRLAIEPLLGHQRASDRGPFRGPARRR